MNRYYHKQSIMITLIALLYFTFSYATVNAATLSGHDPIGHVDGCTSTSPGVLNLSGWTIDPTNTYYTIDVHAYIGGPYGSAHCFGVNLGAAGTLRVDVASCYPGTGKYHGFDRHIQVPAEFTGDQLVYTYGINVGEGNNVLLGVNRVYIKPFTSANHVTPTVFKQTDPRFSGYPYGYASQDNKRRGIHATLGSGGCGPLSIVNAVYYLTNNFVDPITLADWSVAWGYRPIGGTKEGLAKALCDKKGSLYGIKFLKNTTDLESVKWNLYTDSVAVAHVKSHFVSIVDYDPSTDKYLVLDSYPTKNRLGGTYAWKSLSQFVGKLSIANLQVIQKR